MNTVIQVASRTSPLARAQVQEVLANLQEHNPHIKFHVNYVKTTGDIDLKTSLRTLGNTDFFTREVDALVLNQTCQIGIHSAKDLPQPMHPDLDVIALTHGQDPSDSIVLRNEETLDTLIDSAVIATSSERREAAVLELTKKVRFCDLRGTIADRLNKLSNRKADGIVVAEAALIRLGLTHLNRISLPGPTTPFQGQLAIVARKNDKDMRHLFSPLDSRIHPLKTLYLGIDVPSSNRFIHWPIIQTPPYPSSKKEIRDFFSKIPYATHLLFTSKNGVRYFFSYLKELKLTLNPIEIVAVGHATAEVAREFSTGPIHVAPKETAEGIIELLDKIPHTPNRLFLWPHSELSRPIISDYLKSRQIPFADCILYTTKPNPLPYPSLKVIQEVCFTSPSTVDAYLHLYGDLPRHKRLTAIGPVTQQHLFECLQSHL